MTRKAWAKGPNAPARLSGHKGQQRRALWLSQQPLCVMCEAMTPPRVTAGAEVDHIQPLAKGGADVWDNLQTLCHDHHRDKSAMDKGHRVRLTTGADGWPIETGYNPRKV